MIGIAVAMKSELRCLTNRPVKKGEIFRAGDNLLIILSEGIGEKHAVVSAETLIKHGATALLSWGCAGGLNGKTLPGTIVIPRYVLSDDLTRYSTDVEWHSSLAKNLHNKIPFLEDPIIHSREAVATKEAKFRLHEISKAVAVDMESGPIAHMAKSHNMPFMTIRAICDSSTMEIPPIFFKNTAFNALKKIHRYPGYVYMTVKLFAGLASAQSSLKNVNNLIFPLLNTLKL